MCLTTAKKQFNELDLKAFHQEHVKTQSAARDKILGEVTKVMGFMTCVYGAFRALGPLEKRETLCAKAAKGCVKEGFEVGPTLKEYMLQHGAEGVFDA